MLSIIRSHASLQPEKLPKHADGFVAVDPAYPVPSSTTHPQNEPQTSASEPLAPNFALG